MYVHTSNDSRANSLCSTCAKASQYSSSKKAVQRLRFNCPDTPGEENHIRNNEGNAFSENIRCRDPNKTTNAKHKHDTRYERCDASITDTEVSDQKTQARGRTSSEELTIEYHQADVEENHEL